MLLGNGLAIIEHGAFSEVQEFWLALRDQGYAYEVLVDGCMYGLQCSDGPIKKPWRFMVTDEKAFQGVD